MPQVNLKRQSPISWCHMRITAYATSHWFKDIKHIYHLKVIDMYLNTNQSLLTSILFYILPLTLAHSIIKQTNNGNKHDLRSKNTNAILNENLFCSYSLSNYHIQVRVLICQTRKWLNLRMNMLINSHQTNREGNKSSSSSSN